MEPKFIAAIVLFIIFLIFIVYLMVNEMKSAFTKAKPESSVATAPAMTASPVVTLQKPDIKDAGYPSSTRGWYDAEGLGCYNYCRYVGDGSPYFSCMSVDRQGSKVSPNIYSAKGVYTEQQLASKKC